MEQYQIAHVNFAMSWLLYERETFLKKVLTKRSFMQKK